MSTRTFAMILGVVFLIVGILGFVPALRPHHVDMHHDLTVDQSEGYLFGPFHVNVLHNIVHIVFGVLGILMARRFDSARLYCRIVAVAYAILTIMGLIPNLNTVFGLIPIHGHDVWLHAAIAIVAGYFGFAGPVERTGDTTTTTTTTRPAV